MTDFTNDIDSLIRYLDYLVGCDPQWARAVRALVAERDGYLEGNKQTLRALAEANEIAKRYKRERDEARRMICEDESYNHKSGVTPREVAEDRGWDCFKEGGGMSDIAEIAREIVLKAFTWEVHGDGSVGIDLRGNIKCLSDLNLDAETEVYIRRTIRDHIAFKIVETGAKGDARLIEEERKRNERRAQGGGA